MASTNSTDSPDPNPSINSPNSTLALNKAVANLDEQCTTWKSHLGSTDSIDRIATEHAVTELYESLGKLSPRVIWCESPWQMVAMATVLEKEMTSVAIKRWNSHPGPLRLSENDFDNLWKNLWRRIDAQVIPGLSTNFMRPDQDSIKKTEENWANNWLNKLSFNKLPTPETTTNTTTYTVRSEWLRLAKEMRAGCAVRLEQDPAYAQIEKEYRDKLVSHINNSTGRQLRAEFIAFSSAGFSLGISRISLKTI